MHDDELKKRFKTMAGEDAAATPDLSAVILSEAKNLAPARRTVLTAAASIVVAAVTLLIGAVWGTNTGYASGRVDGQRQREIAAAGASNQLAELRVALARTRADLAQRAKVNHTLSIESMSAALAELQAMDASIRRIESDLASGPLVPIPTDGPPMKRALAITCDALASAPPAKPLQQGIPVVDLPDAKFHTDITFGRLIGIREIRGKVLVNDGGRKQIRLFDTTLASSTLVSDSIPGTSIYYGPYGMHLIPYLGDSSLFEDFPSGTILVLNAEGGVARSMAPPPDPNATGSLIGNYGHPGIDAKGRLIYMSQPGTMIMNAFNPLTGKSDSKVTPPPDSASIVRGDFDLRRVDTLAKVQRSWLGGRLTFEQPVPDKPAIMKITTNPLPEPDEWAVLSDGTVGLVRGHDYHIDWIMPDGTRSSTGKLPFDWRKLTDEDKKRIIDSTRDAQNMVANNVRALLAASSDEYQKKLAASDPGGGRGQRGGGGSGRPQPPRLLEVAPPTELPDFYPPIRLGATMADADGNMWILPATSAQTKHGELVYDVVSPKLGLYKRVRVPLGRSIAGFAKGGVVYLQSGDRASGFYLERTRMK